MDENNIPETGALFNFGEIGSDELEMKLWIKNDKITSLSCGDEFCVILTKSGRAFAYGKNDWGQLGLTDNKTVLTPSCIKVLKNLNEKAVLVACGRCHSLIWTENKKLFGFGCNNDGQLGLDESISSTTVPKQITSWIHGDICQLAAGGDFSAAINENGKLYVWGSNSEYQLGLGDRSDEVVYKPMILSFFKNPVDYVDCGSYHAAAISQGKLYVWGECTNHKLGGGFQENQSTPQEILVNILIKQVSCGHNHTVCLSESGDVYVWGKGDSGQLGLNLHDLNTEFPKFLRVQNLLIRDSGDGLEDIEKFIHVSAGESHTVIVTTKGLALSFGDGRHGKLGNIGGASNYSNYMRPKLMENLNKDLWVYNVQCGGCHSVVLVRNREPHEQISDIFSEHTFTTADYDSKSLLSDKTDFNSISLRARQSRREHMKTQDSDLPTLIQSNDITEIDRNYSKSNGEIEEHINVTSTVQKSHNENNENKRSPDKKNSKNESKTNPIDTKSKATNPEIAHVGCAANCKRNQNSAPKQKTNSTETKIENENSSTISINTNNANSKQESKTCNLI